jgi:hypothetical protein
VKVKENRIEGIGIIQMHLNGGFTKVLWEETIGVGLADGGIDVDILTASIPLHLRNINTRFYLTIENNNIKIEEIKE